MALDNKQRKLARGLKHNDNPVAAVAAGARTGNAKLVIDALAGALSTMPLGEQRAILAEIANLVSGKTKKDAKFKDTKAFDIRGPSLGKLTPAELFAVIDKAVSDAIAGVDNDLIGSGYQSNVYSYSGHRKTKAQIKKDIRDSFDDWSGAYRIALGGDIRIYAIHEPPTKEEAIKRIRERKLAKHREELERREAAIKAAAEKEKKLKAELEKLAQDEKRYKENLEKAKKELEELESSLDGQA